MNFHTYNGKIEYSNEIDIPYFIQVTVRVLPCAINNIEVLNQAIQRADFSEFMEISPFSLMRVPYFSKDAYTTTYRRRVDRTKYQDGDRRSNDELNYFLKNLKKAGCSTPITDRQVWDVDIEKV